MMDKTKKNEIKKAANKIPGLIFEQIKFSKATKNKKIEKDYSEEKRKRIAWVGVIIFTIIVLIMWSWNTFVNFDILLKKGDNSIFDEVKKNFEFAKQKASILEPNINTSTNKILIDEELENKIKNSLDILITQINNSTSTQTTTATEVGLPLSKNINHNEETKIHQEL